MNLDLAWDPPLQSRKGAAERLCGIQVFHDFRWLDVFPDERTHFKNGKVLDQTVKEQCTTGLTPALLLTRRDDVEQGLRTTDSHFLFILNIDEWRRTPGNPALSYIANHLPVAPNELGGLAQLAELGVPDEIRAFVERQLDVEQIASWLSREPDRIQRLAEVVDFSTLQPTPPSVLEALRNLEKLDDEQYQQLVQSASQLISPEQLGSLFRGAMDTEIGRRIAGASLQDRLEDRIDDARKNLDAYNKLLSSEKTTETEMQRFLSDHPLLFGLEYASIKPQVTGPSGSMDFILERFDGYNDLVELKSPGDSIIKSPAHEPGSAVPSPHSYRLSGGLAQALAQALTYRDRLTRHASAAIELHGIPNPREPRLLIVLGQEASLQGHQKNVLVELNRSLHRVEIRPYDVIATRARASLDNIVSYLRGTRKDATDEARDPTVPNTGGDRLR